jgi:hypothetical protein
VWRYSSRYSYREYSNIHFGSISAGMTLVIFIAVAVMVMAFAIRTVVYIVLIRHHVPMRQIWGGAPGYLARVCEQLPPSQENRRLARFARWSDIVLVLTFVVLIVAVQIHT